MKKTLFAAIAASLFAAPLAAETLTVGAYPANPPWEYKTEASTFEGFEVDMVTEIALRLGMDLEISDLGFQALFAATASGRVDLAISTITITDERLQSQSFTQGFYDADMALLTVEGGPAGLEDMRGQVVGTIAAGTGEAWITEHMDEIGFAEMRTYPDQQGMILDVRAGRLGGAINDLTGFIFATQEMPGMVIAETITTGDQYGLMLAQGSELLGPVNDTITAMKEDGTMAEIYERWLGAPAPEGSATVTVLPIPEAG